MGGLFLYGLLPLLIFAVIDAFSHRVSFAVGAAVLCAFGELLLLYQVTGQVDPVSLAAVFLFIVFGLFSVRRDNRRLFKLQPAVLAGLTGGLVGYLEFFGQPVVYRYLPLSHRLFLEFSPLLSLHPGAQLGGFWGSQSVTLTTTVI